MPTYPYFSCSRIQTFRKCPKAFEFSYILELSEEFQTIEKHLGTAVHEVFEWIYRERLAGREVDDQAVTQKYGQVWQALDIATARIVKKGVLAAEYFAQGLAMVVAYHDSRIHSDDSRTLHLELQFDLPLGEGRVYRGIIDRVSRKQDGTICLIDYKTGRSVPDPQSDLQLRSYTLAMFAAYADERLEICYEALRGGNSLAYVVERDHSAAIKAEVDQAIDEIVCATAFPAKPSTLCDWCGHLQRCPEGQKHLRAYELAAANNVCPHCGSELKKRVGKFGPFLSCPKFPHCRFSRNI